MHLKIGENDESKFVSMKFIVKCVYYSDAQFTEIDILHVCM